VRTAEAGGRLARRAWTPHAMPQRLSGQSGIGMAAGPSQPNR
jgi:hypothetical protein